jgi:hypothetical protein
VCRGCLTDGDCGGATPRCDPGSERCVACLPTNDNCQAGQYCQVQNGVSSCVPGCKGDSDCGSTDGGSGGDGGVAPGQMACCNHQCADVSQDATNCGACGKQCSGSAGSCCIGRCVDLSTDVDNCTACGNGCQFANAAASCLNGCVMGACQPGYGDCDTMSSNGCETNLNTSTTNCGSCGASCATAVANASGAACDGTGVCTYTGSCSAGFGDCDGNKANGCETDTTANVTACGNCTTNCNTSVVNATGIVCTNSTCTYAACAGSFGDCDGNKANGCEANLSTTVTACGSCSTNCNVKVANAAGIACAAAQCTYTGGCTGTFQDCDGNKANGCEADKNNDSVNCGSCGNSCVPKGMTCSGGACVPCKAEEVYGNAQCFYLDGSNSACDPGYSLVAQSVLATVGSQFVGKSVKHTNFNNCCIANSDGVENYGLGGTDCTNYTGPWTTGPLLGGANCTNQMIHQSQQLTLCGDNESDYGNHTPFTTQNPWTNSYWIAVQVNVPVATTVIRLGWYSTVKNNAQYQLALYNGATQPNALLALSGVGTVNGGFNEQVIPPTIITPGTYWVAMNMSITGTWEMQGTGPGVFYQAFTFNTGAPASFSPAPFGAGSTYNHYLVGR